MSNTNTGGPAFPTQSKLGVNDTSTWIAEIPGQPGMTLRDYFAAKAMQSAFVEASFGFTLEDYRHLSKVAYAMADAMLKAREA